jgi:hypothetical protein
MMQTATARGCCLLLGRSVLRLRRRFLLLVLLAVVFILRREAHQHVSQRRIAALGELCDRTALAERAGAGRFTDRAALGPDLVLIAQEVAKVNPEAVLDAG